jgi:transposase
MRKIEDVLRLHAQGMSTRRIALATGVGKTTVIEYLRRAAVAGLSWPLPEGLDEEALERRVFPPPPPSQDRQFAAADWAGFGHFILPAESLGQRCKINNPSCRFRWPLPLQKSFKVLSVISA